MATRRHYGEGSVYQRPDGLWCGQIDVGYVNGRRRRRTLYDRDHDALIRRLRVAHREIEAGHVATRNITVERWLNQWLDDVIAVKRKPRTLQTYRSYVNAHLIPELGKKRLDKLTPQHVEEMLATITSSPTTRLHAYRILSTALERAFKSDMVPANVCKKVEAPTPRKSQRTGLTAEEARKVLGAAQGPMLSRWQAALMTGARQGELLGLRWSHVDLKDAKVEIAWSLQRVPYSHGCNGRCGKKRAASCPEKVCRIPDGYEAQHLRGNIYLLRPKSQDSRRIVPLLPALKASLELHREATADQPNPHDLVWHHPDGRPLDGRRDWQAWKDLLASVKIDGVTLHEARNTVATLLLEAGVDSEVVKKMLGHSNVVVTRGYQFVRLDLMRDAVDRLGQTLELDK